MINYIQNKSINFSNIEELLKKSAKLNLFTNGGPVKAELEHYLAQLLEVDEDKTIICMSSGTAALHALMFLYEKKYEKEHGNTHPLRWATISYNFPSAVVNLCNTDIIDIELHKNGYSIPLDDLKAYGGFIFPTLFGALPQNLQECLDFCEEHKIIIILDNASSPLSSFNRTNICNIGTASFGSLHHTKYLGFGEGGFAVVDKDDYLAIEAIANFGFYQNRDYISRASNFKMSDVSAAFILSHIKQYSVEKHLRVQDNLCQKLLEVGIEPFAYDTNIVYGNLPIAFEQPTSHLVFRDYGIEANKYYQPLAATPHSKTLFDRMVNFPLYADLSTYEINKLVSQIAYQKSLETACD
jgi:dTDP-4-amino-4,6-dideoxygalactose transaminase